MENSLSFIEKLKNTSSIAAQEDVGKYLKESKLPLVLYGAGDLARWAKSELSRQDIKIDFISVDKKYWTPDMKFMGIDVLPLDDILQNCDKVNVIVAFICKNDRETVEMLNKTQKVQRCFLMPTVNVFRPINRFDSVFLDKNASCLREFYDNLADDLSCKILFEYLMAFRTGTLKEITKLMLEHNLIEEKQYFPDFLALSDNETYIDCGLFNLGTIEDFLAETNCKFNKVFGFEPDTSYFIDCKKRLAFYETLKGVVNETNVILLEKGVWSKKQTLHFFSNYDCPGSSRISETGYTVEVDSIDNVLGNEKATFIKMDIEGSELEALKGTEKQIRDNKPKLAICVYHKEEDLITIPQYILSLNPEYKLYLRHHCSCSFTELVLYAI